MRISNEAVEKFKQVGSSAGNVHRATVFKYGVYPSCAAKAINEIARNGMTDNTRELHEAVFLLAKEYDAKERLKDIHDLPLLLSRIEKLENKPTRRIEKWLGCMFQQESLRLLSRTGSVLFL
jgi:hypothetical protein